MGNLTSREETRTTSLSSKQRKVLDILSNDEIMLKCSDQISATVQKRLNEIDNDKIPNIDYVTNIVQLDLIKGEIISEKLFDHGLVCAMRITPQFVKDVEDNITKYIQPKFKFKEVDVAYDENITTRAQFSFSVKV